MDQRVKEDSLYRKGQTEGSHCVEGEDRQLKWTSGLAVLIVATSTE